MRRPRERFAPPYPPLTGSEPCTNDPELWFSTSQSDRVIAEQECRACPVVRECLAWALAHEAFGVWGATSEDERARLRSVHRIGLTPVNAHRAPARVARSTDFDDSED